MRLRRTVAAVIAAATLAVGLVAAPASAATNAACPASIPTAGYADVPADSSYLGAIDCITWWDVSKGTGFGTYAPRTLVRRDQMATFIARLVERIGGDLPAYASNEFDDVSYDNPYRTDIARLASVGLVSGTSRTTYSPAQLVTRAQMATFLVRAHEFARNKALPAGPDAFTDDNGSPYETNINQAAAAGITTGTGPGTFSPYAGVRRDQMALFMARVLNLAVVDGYSNVPVEQTMLSGDGDGLTERFRLRAGAEYRAEYQFTNADCFYGAFLQPEDEDNVGQDIASGMGPLDGTRTIVNVVAD